MESCGWPFWVKRRRRLICSCVWWLRWKRILRRLIHQDKQDRQRWLGLRVRIYRRRYRRHIFLFFWRCGHWWVKRCFLLIIFWWYQDLQQLWLFIICNRRGFLILLIRRLKHQRFRILWKRIHLHIQQFIFHRVSRGLIIRLWFQHRIHQGFWWWRPLDHRL